MATAAIDVPHLAAFTSVPEETITTLLQAPTAELVQSFLASVSAKARAYDQEKAKALRRDVEYESAVRGGESKAKVLKINVERNLIEITNLRETLQKEGQCRSHFRASLQY
jgi:nucleoprotein TPR